LRQSLAAREIEDVILVSELRAAGALAQAVGQALAHDTTALMFITRDTATLSVVETADGSIGTVLRRKLRGSDALAELTEMATDLEAHESRPQALFVVGSGVDITPVKSHLENRVLLPVIAPEDPELALARGAALAAANAPRLEASTTGLAYSKDPDGTPLDPVGAIAGATGPLSLAEVATQLAPVVNSAAVRADSGGEFDHTPERRWLFVPVGSSLAAIFVIGVVALVITVAANVRPTADQRRGLIEQAIPPSAMAPASPIAQGAPAAQIPPAAPQAQPAPQQPTPEAISNPMTVVRQAPRTVVVEAPAVKAPAAAPKPAARAVAGDTPTAAPQLAAPMVTLPAAVPQLPASAVTPPAVTPPLLPPAILLPQITVAPILRAPTQDPSGTLSPWSPTSLWIPTQPSQPQQIPQDPQTAHQPLVSLLQKILQWPQQQPPQATPTAQWPTIPLWPQRQSTQQQVPQGTQIAQSPEIPLLPQSPLWPQR
jgi:hypothetical protein